MVVKVDDTTNYKLSTNLLVTNITKQNILHAYSNLILMKICSYILYPVKWYLF